LCPLPLVLSLGTTEKRKEAAQRAAALRFVAGTECRADAVALRGGGLQKHHGPS